MTEAGMESDNPTTAVDYSGGTAADDQNHGPFFSC